MLLKERRNVRSEFITLIADRANPVSEVLFLGYDNTKTKLIPALYGNKCRVWHCDGQVEDLSQFDLVISFGYRHIIRPKVLEKTTAPILNLHISYLPWNRGAHPNFWAFYDDTPSGVSIHLVDKGIDTGPIVYQKEVEFTKYETSFSSTYKRLIWKVEDLFIDNISDIIGKRFSATPQSGPGTYKRLRDLPAGFSGWSADIDREIRRLRSGEV
ncbi:formyltransferase family protein [Thalassobaculum sp. OXR-137]|uniref:formyltransferase family protein n=1 Tax=Thalassobaculum sp. OXR-137 TaxID=3100173 RepID=UPI002AC9A363|nr:formyltransferase family protein [Thalassobaculum sp. OXR-137]WPZ33927.1 formyltransferase family protein [Thalassobaculum sp. OXR-137]